MLPFAPRIALRLWLLLLVAVLAVAEPRAPMAARNFDWDGNIALLNSPIYIYKKGTREPTELSPTEYARYEKTIGKSGLYANYELGPGSFRNFKGKKFLQQVSEAIASGNDAFWQGPAWKEFAEACSQRETAQWVTIITAREHEREDIMAGLKLLKKHGYIRYLPRIDHIYPVGNPMYKMGADNDPEAKERVMEMLLNRLSALKLAPGEQHIWTYQDDDLNNIEQARQLIERHLKEHPGKWANVKIILAYTGSNPDWPPPFKKVMLPDGSDRDATEEEWAEAATLVKTKYPPRRCRAMDLLGAARPAMAH